jgi:AraC-like DNA-binding protein
VVEVGWDLPDSLRALLGTGTGDRNRAAHNYAGYCNAAIDQLLRAALSEADAGKRDQMLRQANQALYDDVAWIPLMHAQGRHAPALMPLFEAITRETRLHTPGELAAGSALLMALFVQIARLADLLLDDPADPATARGDRPRKAAQVERFRALLDQHFRERWPVERYAQELGISAGQLTRLCRDQLGQSALDVINARVLHEAERELVYSILGVKQIAGLLGFADEAYFGRFFKKHTGRTPSEFRAVAKERLAPEEYGLVTC